MSLSRWELLPLVAGAALLGPRATFAQSYPTRPLRIVVGFPPGGGQDIVARMTAPLLSERLNQPVVIENRPGAGSNLAAEVVVNAPPDGYTLLLAGSPNTINATLYQKLNFSFMRDIVPVAEIMRVPLVIVVSPALPVKTLAELIAYVRSEPEKINMASAGNGTPHHIGGELFKMMTGLKMTHVPYRGEAPAMTDLLSNHVQVLFGSMTASIEFIKVGKVRALAVTSARRSDALPEVPTVAELVPGYEAHTWYGIGVPRQTPATIADALNAAIQVVLADPRMQASIAKLGGSARPGSPSDFGRSIAEETEKWGNVIRSAGLKPE
ncbi:MAG: tripartite tricarboxylate transporter substrate binding protein [Hyphomicrobiales bacterium]|nr:tripartite tricarboxylate transporter substrate binding protein [Hyphomicrobiales bacterium]